jgi:5-formaminoimidazole-4-carboxamide-1-beta-D-ribofuranosyl 5'-monophosphate synthetase
MRLPTIGMIGSHSAGEIGVSPKSHSFQRLLHREEDKDKTRRYHNETTI